MLDQIKELMKERQTEFYDYLCLESVSAQGRNIQATADYVEGMLRRLGGETEQFNDFGGHPLVYGFFPAGPGGNPERTLLYYNHYDVQPEEPIDEWQSAPFEPEVRDGRLYARGVADNKANLMTRLLAIELLQQAEGGLPVNVKFVVEGEEEIGSPTIDRYVERYRDKFQADACIWEFGSKNEAEEYVVSAGVKGCVYFDLEVETADTDIHSSKAAIFDNAAWRMVQALSSMRTVDNKVVVDDFYQPMLPPSSRELQLTRDDHFDPGAASASYGVKQPLITETLDHGPTEALVLYPTLTIAGLQSGYNGPGTKTVLPRRCTAKLDVRTVPGYTADRVESILRQHLDRRGFQDIHLSLITDVMPFRTDVDDPFLALVVETAKQVYGTDRVKFELNSPGSGPMYSFGHHLGVPVVSSGCGNAQSNAHGPNENVRLEDFQEAVYYQIKLLQAMA